MLLKKNKIFFLFLILIILLISFNAEAAIDNKDLFNNVLTEFKNSSAAWGVKIETHATWLYWLLVTISMVFTFGFMILRKADIGELFAEFIRFTLFVGFFWWLLTNGPNFAIDIIDSLKDIASDASGFSKKLQPSGLVDMGFQIFDAMVNNISFSLSSLVGVFLSLFILFIMTLIGFNMLLLLVSSWIMAYAGIFFLGFGGSRWTSEIAINYFKTVLGLAIQILTLILIIGIGRDLIFDYYSKMNTSSVSIKEMAVLSIVALVIYLLTDKLPAFMSGVITGASIGQNAGHVGGGAALAASAAAMGTAAVAMKSAAASMAGGASAVYNSVTQAAANVGDGSDIVSKMMGGSSDGSKNESSSGSSPLKEAMGLSNDSPVSSSTGSKAASFVGDTGKMVADSTANLAQGGWNAMKENASDAISGTVGGQIANQIKSSGETSDDNNKDGGEGVNKLASEIADVLQNHFDGNNLSASFSNTDTTLDEEAEVAAFRDKDS